VIAMAKKKGSAFPTPVSQDKPATLKDLLNTETLDKLKAQADEWKAEEDRRKEEVKKQADEARKAEKKRLENDFEHLLNNSNLNWRDNK
jgi:hypothetical protein